MASTTIFFFPPKGMSSSHYKWECILAKNRTAESKLWDSIQASSVRFRKKQKQEQRDFILIANTIKNAQ